MAGTLGKALDHTALPQSSLCQLSHNRDEPGTITPPLSEPQRPQQVARLYELIVRLECHLDRSGRFLDKASSLHSPGEPRQRKGFTAWNADYGLPPMDWAPGHQNQGGQVPPHSKAGMQGWPQASAQVWGPAENTGSMATARERTGSQELRPTRAMQWQCRPGTRET